MNHPILLTNDLWPTSQLRDMWRHGWHDPFIGYSNFEAPRLIKRDITDNPRSNDFLRVCVKGQL